MIKKKIIDEIKKNKGISLDKFINVCLFDKHGYYKSADIIGKRGDFITAPEISQLFGEILGLYIFCVWKEKYNRELNLIELGPGNGTLLIDALRITKSLSNFHNNLNIYLIEENDFLIKKQKKNLLANKFNNLNLNWYDNILNINKKPSIIIANEFFDCLPIRQFEKKKEKWLEKKINYNYEQDIFFYQYLPVNENKILKKLSEYKKNNFIELSEKRKNYFEKICEYITKSTGTCIIIDYGYDKLPGHFTLQSIFNHKPSNLFDNLGNQDITSLVDFNAFIDIAKNYKINIDTYCNQKEFLLANGLLERKKKIMQRCSPDQIKVIESGYDRLIDEKQMGSIFKFLVLSSN